MNFLHITFCGSDYTKGESFCEWTMYILFPFPCVADLERELDRKKDNHLAHVQKVKANLLTEYARTSKLNVNIWKEKAEFQRTVDVLLLHMTFHASLAERGLCTSSSPERNSFIGPNLDPWCMAYLSKASNPMELSYWSFHVCILLILPSDIYEWQNE